MNDDARPGEFELIAELFAPLAAGLPGAFGLRDDAAVLTPPAGRAMVVTTDMLVAGVHFPADEDGSDVARRLLRVNLSDLAAMGARPVAYLLALGIPDAIEMGWLRRFADGLADDQEEFGIHLAGGDTTSTPGPLTASITAIGEAPVGGELRRSTAHAGDLVYVSGAIGDAALGLIEVRDGLTGVNAAARAGLARRYRLPQPRVGLGIALRGVASACADVSDGLVADLDHICEASGVAAEIQMDRVPLSDAARQAIGHDPSLMRAVVTGGDDYELVFTVPPAVEDRLSTAAGESGVSVTGIGRVIPGRGVTVFDGSGAPLELESAGYRHF